MKKIILLVTILIVTLTLSACSTNADLASVGLEGLNGKQILTGVADGSIVVDGFGLSVYDDELVVFIDDSRISVDMPENEFYLSVAPYITSTHTCEFHSATGCRGELKQEIFYVEYVDLEGNVVISKNMTSLSNGFIDLWLPRNIDGVLTITQDGLSASKIISTSAGEPTCETTMQLT